MRTLLVSPIEPADSGNGLAMRAGMLLDSLSRFGAVDLAVMSLAGQVRPSPWTDDRCERRWQLRSDSADAVASAADPYWRSELVGLEPRPALAGDAWPGTGLRLADEIGGSALVPEVVVGLRSYLAPVAAAAARRLGAGFVLDLDDDDVSVASPDERAAWARLVARSSSWADGVAAASPGEADEIGSRLGREVTFLPNVVAPVTPPVAPGPTGADRVLSLLYVGNLTYEPNRAAVDELVGSILPRLVRAELTLVGSAHEHDAQIWADSDRVRYVGWVQDVGPFYEACDVVVAPIRTGSGTRIKILEAMAHRRPVVATPAAVAGLAVENRRHLLLEDTVEGLVGGVEALRDARLASELVSEAAEYVRRRHHPDRAAEIVGRLIGATA